MQILRLIPATFSCLLIAAHFQRAGTPTVAILCLFLPALLLIPRRLSTRVMQLLLICFALEWLRTLLSLVQIRMDHDMPWLRLAAIIGIVTIFTLFSALCLRVPVKKSNSSR